MQPGQRLPVVEISYDEMTALLDNPDTRIIDSRMLEMYDSFTFALQVLMPNDTIIQTTSVSKEALQLYRLQYKHNTRNNPGLYGLLEEDKK